MRTGLIWMTVKYETKSAHALFEEKYETTTTWRLPSHAKENSKTAANISHFRVNFTKFQLVMIKVSIDGAC